MIYIENNYRMLLPLFLFYNQNRLLYRTYPIQAECYNDTSRLIYNRQTPTQHFMTNLANDEKKNICQSI